MTIPTAQLPSDDPTNVISADAAAKPTVEKPICGVIMPISNTERFSAEHWRDVNTLTHRCIKIAGFSPKNVWENSSTDRVSERIIGNIFESPIVIADISDLNPNVMLEVGLRLASKKPTVVTMATGSVIPFDLRDFHAIEYPSDLNILSMEVFFQRISKVLKDKFESAKTETYVPFLGNVIVDVISPEKREVGPDQLVLKRLDEMNETLQRALSSTRSVDAREAVTRTVRRIAIKDDPGVVTAYIPKERFEDFRDGAGNMFEIDSINHSVVGDDVRARVSYSGCTDIDEFSSAFNELVTMHSGRFRVRTAPSGATDA